MKAKYRPFKNCDEFIKQTGLEVGDEIEIKSETKHYVLTIKGFNSWGLVLTNGLVGGSMDFKDLFIDYKIKINREWQPFGVEE